MGSSRHDIWRRVLDQSPGMVVLLDEEMRVRWFNQAVTGALGWTLDDVLGRSVLDFVDPEWDPIAVESIAPAFHAPGVRPPITFRAIAADGSRPILEVTANNQFDDPVIGAMVVYARPWTERWLLDQVLDAMAADVPARDSLELLVRVAGADTLVARASFVTDFDGRRASTTVAAAELAAPLAGPTFECSDEAADAWAKILDQPVEQVLDVDELPAVLAGPARLLGLRTLWVWPYEHARNAESRLWILAWRREAHLDLDQTRRQTMTRLVRLAGLIVDGDRRRVAVEYAASHDALTGLANRASFHRRLQAALAGLPLDGLAVGYIDLDDFKPINDRFGHAAGDRVLAEVGDRLRSLASESGFEVARIGGDEFATIVRVSDADRLHELGRRIVEVVSSPVSLRAGEIVPVGASIGFASCDLGGDHDVDALVDAADAALYEAKRRGGGIEVVSPFVDSTD